MLAAELALNKAHPATWEKKGNQLLTTRNVAKYAHVREGIHRLLNELYKCNGRLVYYGRQKYLPPEQGNASGLYTTVMSHMVRSIDAYCCKINAQFMMILDQHSDRLKLLESATKTMFSGGDPARCLIEPPFQVESHLYQTIQAADWMATLVGRYLTYGVEPTQYADWEWADRFFGQKVRNLTTHSRLWRPQAAQINIPFSKPAS